MGHRAPPLLENAIPEPNSGCLIWFGYSKNGRYGTYRGKMAHRLSYMMANKVDLSPSQNVLHKCDNGFCINPDHLFIGTHTDNMRDMVAKGRNKPNKLKGRELPQSHNFSDEDIRYIRSRRKSQLAYAFDFSVARTTINSIQNGYSWRHVT